MSPLKRTALSPLRLRLLPAVMAVAAIALVIRAGHFAGDLSRFVSEAQAQEEEDAARERPAENGPAQTEDGTAPAASESESAGSAALEDLQAIAGVSASERQLLQELAQRRRELEEREQEIGLREQLLASTERRIDKRIAELKTLEKRIEALVEEHKAREDAQLANIVKVYETMKPKDAAPIFQRLDLPIQIAVATRMKERSMAALLAEMDPDAAKTLTTRLATRNELPDAAQLLENSSPS